MAVDTVIQPVHRKDEIIQNLQPAAFGLDHDLPLVWYINFQHYVPSFPFFVGAGGIRTRANRGE